MRPTDSAVIVLPDAPFRALTAAVVRRFPGYQPYGGAFDDVVPHLTVGEDAAIQAMRSAAEAIMPQLPVLARITTAWLRQGSSAPGSWHTVAEFPLGQG